MCRDLIPCSWGNVNGQGMPTWSTQTVSWGNDSDQPFWLYACADQAHITSNTAVLRFIFLGSFKDTSYKLSSGTEILLICRK